MLRERGRRKNDHAIQSDPGTTGDLTLAAVAGVMQLNLAAFNDQQMKPLVPILYQAELVTMHGDKMLFRGYESVDGAGYVQEWSAIVLAGARNA
jgi:hypothetical protein